MKPHELRAIAIILAGAVIIALSSCTDNHNDVDIRDGLLTYDTIPRQQLTEEMQVWENIDSSRVIVVR